MENYTQLQADVKNWLSSPDLTSAEIDNFIKQGTAKINRVLRVSGMETSTDLTLDAKEVSLPSDFRGARSLYIDSGDGYELRFMAPEVLHSLQRSGTGLPKYFTIRGATLVLDVTPDSTYTGKLSYYAKFDTIDGTTTTNWLTANEPDLLLWACCVFGAMYIRDDELLQRFNGFLEATLAEVQESNADVYGPAPVMRTENTYP